MGAGKEGADLREGMRMGVGEEGADGAVRSHQLRRAAALAGAAARPQALHASKPAPAGTAPALPSYRGVVVGPAGCGS